LPTAAEFVPDQSEAAFHAPAGTNAYAADDVSVASASDRAANRESQILYEMGLGVLASPHLLLCCCWRTTDRTDSDDSLTMASLKVMVMSSDRSSGFRPGFTFDAIRKARIIKHS